MKNYLVVGHSSGIGKALSKKLAESNQVIGTYYKNEVLSSQNVSSHYLNVLDDQPDFSFLPETLDGLAYCPGAIQLKPFARLKEDDFIADFKLQVSGAIKVIQHCLPALKKSESGSIVLFSTVAVKMGFTFHSLVSTSKGAIEGLTKALAAELAPAIKVNCIAPSITNTPLAGSLLNTQEKIDANAQRHPLKKIGTPEDIATMAAYLLSDENSWITGQIFSVDGGISSIR
ncbi:MULTISPECIES: SDR family oxidoreductase [unclassified Spirosoma]|uniref:SDR family NAD(P)-dependent oxidoreductase n=1 Tax=unclassified Spirosoma TaxID=2621999 RepID=UPI0009637D4C|nr:MULTISPECIES: SDR family oxidoreductase [unclassified Spirosoma]MBN8822335.1 SDR family oxidoreductase [Spirosoma sp.]OJW72365.1 MAG: oxidoreductase [Spirosoma sp. 48-14]